VTSTAARARSGEWRPTAAQLRAATVAVVALGVGVVARRADLMLFAVPFAIAATWGALRRPTASSDVQLGVEAASLFEGQSTRLFVAVDVGGPDIDVVTVVLEPDEFTVLDVASPVLAMTPSGSTRRTFDLCTVRWGKRAITVRQVVCTSPLGAYRSTQGPMRPIRMSTLPLRETFAAVDSIPRPAGIVGLHRSRRPGDGSEFADVRPFQLGDRLRRVNWPISLRTGELHVNSTWSDRDTEVVLILDTEHDYGHSEGIDGAASSLDTAVRATASIAEHYLRHGDRVSVVDLGQRVRRVPAGTGRGHLRRILDVLVAATPGEVRGGARRRIRPPRHGDLVVVLSPVTGTVAASQVAVLVAQGHTVILIDTLPTDIVAQSETGWAALAWRLRLLERQVELDQLMDLGVPVVAWRGSGSLDDVLRRVSRLSSAPRVRGGSSLAGSSGSASGGRGGRR